MKAREKARPIEMSASFTHIFKRKRKVGTWGHSKGEITRGLIFLNILASDTQNRYTRIKEKNIMENNFERPINPTSWSNSVELSKTAKFMSRVYGWMMLGVGMSGIVAYAIAQNTNIAEMLMQNRGAIWGIILLQLALVVIIPTAMNRMSSSLMGLLYFIYAGVTGVTLSFIFLAYTQSSIFSMFFLTAFSFGGLSATGYVTKKDLGPIGSACIMVLWGMIAFSLLAMFFPSLGGGAASLAFGLIGVLVFSGLTAYHTQKIKAIYTQSNTNAEGESKLAIFGALTLYLDFINLFLSLLRVFGRRR
jgi:FtsH-binding integral membrane protein